MCSTPSSMRATLLRTTPSSSSTLRYPVLRIVRHGRIGPLLTTGNAIAKAQLAKALSSMAASRVATKKYSLCTWVWFGAIQAPSCLNQNPFCITKASCISSFGDNAMDLSQVSRSLPLGVWTRYQRTRPCWQLVVAPLKAPGSSSWCRIVCSMFPAPLFQLRDARGCRGVKNRLRPQLGAVAKVQVFVSSTLLIIRANYSCFPPDCTKCAANGVHLHTPLQNLYRINKKAAHQRLFFLANKKGDRP